MKTICIFLFLALPVFGQLIPGTGNDNHTNCPSCLTNAPFGWNPPTNAPAQFNPLRLWMRVESVQAAPWGNWNEVTISFHSLVPGTPYTVYISGDLKNWTELTAFIPDTADFTNIMPVPFPPLPCYYGTNTFAQFYTFAGQQDLSAALARQVAAGLQNALAQNGFNAGASLGFGMFVGLMGLMLVRHVVTDTEQL